MEPKPVLLFVEDNDDVARIAENKLESYGFFVLRYNRGYEVIEQLRDHDILYDIALVDLELPRVSGAEVVRELKMKYLHRPIFTWSGYELERKVSHSEGHIIKPAIRKERWIELESMLKSSLPSRFR